MIRVTMLYPAAAGSHFDFDYYLGEHLPMSERLLAEHGFIGYDVQRPVSDARGNPPEYLCISHLDFSSWEHFQNAMAAHGETLRADFARYTDITPVATVCEVVTQHSITT